MGVQDVERRQKDLSKRETESKQKFREMCDTHKISGGNCQTELQDSIKSALPKCLENATSKITSNTVEPLKFYEDFSRSLGDNGASSNQTPMTLLHFMIANGNALLKDAAGKNNELKAEWEKVQQK